MADLAPAGPVVSLPSVAWITQRGLVLLTDDGELAHRLTHPRYEHAKTYYVLVETLPTVDALHALRTGVRSARWSSAPAEVEVVQTLPPN